jgi:hypothetical protein
MVKCSERLRTLQEDTFRERDPDDLDLDVFDVRPKANTKTSPGNLRPTKGTPTEEVQQKLSSMPRLSKEHKVDSCKMSSILPTKLITEYSTDQEFDTICMQSS